MKKETTIKTLSKEDIKIFQELSEEEKRSYEEYIKTLSYDGDEYSTIVRESVKMILNNSGKQMLLIRYLVNEDNFKNAKKEIHDEKLMKLMSSNVGDFEKMKLDDQEGIYKECNSIICQLYFYKNWAKGIVDEFLFVYNDKDKHFDRFHVLDRRWELITMEPYLKDKENK